jgi:hypothetical protein
MQEIPDEVSLLWIANFMGKSPNEIYKLKNAGLGPAGNKEKGRYRVSKASLLQWLSSNPNGSRRHD